LPALQTQLFGREKDSATVRDMILHTPGRLVTLTGTGGCGKTQLALLVAAGLADAFTNGVWWIDLATVQAPHLVPYAVASVLGRRDRAGEAILDTLVAYLSGRELLLVLDNCEHLIDACADLVERVLSGCATVRMLSTSRERLRISRETTWRVPSLAIPERRAQLMPDDLLAYPAVQLFVERAKASESDFALRPSNASAVLDICTRLEGLPLALELAAAHVSSLSLTQILERLKDSFRLLVGGSRTAPTRHQTLRATLDWSFGLLTNAEQAFFERLSVFAGEWKLEAAELVCANGSVAPADVLELLARLVDKCLVVAHIDQADGQSRYRLLEPIRQYARARLAESGDLDAVRARHARFYLQFAEVLERDVGVGGSRRLSAADTLVGEYRNLEAALRFALDSRDAELGLRLAAPLQYIWKFRLPVGEGRAWVDELLQLPGAERPTLARAITLSTAARLAWECGDHAAADAYYTAAVPLARRLGDPWILFVALVDKGLQAEHRGQYQLAFSLWQEAESVTLASGDHASEAIALMCIGRLHLFEGDYATGREACEKSLDLSRQVGDMWTVWQTLHALGQSALAHGDLPTAGAAALENLKVPASAQERTATLHLLALVEIAEGKHTAARRHLLEAIALLAKDIDGAAVAQVVDATANLASRLSRPAVALRLAAAARNARDTLVTAAYTSQYTSQYTSPYPFRRDLPQRWLAPVRDGLPSDEADRLWAEGLGLSLAEAVALAGLELSDTTPPSAAPVAGLTYREAEVLRLVARGQSNKEIAAELVVSVRTVERHVTNLYAKIDARGKADATAFAIRHGLV
jgi:predicted ATPase/DNA-binding CsgD family transcriptional regulator